MEIVWWVLPWFGGGGGEVRPVSPPPHFFPASLVRRRFHLHSLFPFHSPFSSLLPLSFSFLPLF